MQSLNYCNISIDRIDSVIAKEKKCDFSILRLDKTHEEISGNKIFKLKYYLQKAIEEKKDILTWGGAFSNHIVATAAACKMNGLKCIGIIRGEEPAEYSHTLHHAKMMEMQLQFVSRQNYRQKTIPASVNTNNYIIVKEGGYGKIGAKGAADICSFFKSENYSHIICATGTGTTLAGLINSCNGSTKKIGISALKNNKSVFTEVKALLTDTTSEFEIIHDYHFGGYAKHNTALIDFMNAFYKKHFIPSDFVYTAKCFYAVEDLIRNGYFPEGSNILALHTGGLQGNFSLNKGTLMF